MGPGARIACWLKSPKGRTGSKFSVMASNPNTATVNVRPGETAPISVSLRNAIANCGGGVPDLQGLPDAAIV